MPEESTTPDLAELARRSIEAADIEGVMRVTRLCAPTNINDARATAERLAEARR